MRYPFDCISDFIFPEDELTPSDLIVIPGGSHPQLMERAAALYHQGMAPYLMPSGGKNPKLPDHVSEAAFLQSLGVAAGVPSDHILCEHRAANTFDNANFSLELVKSLGLEVHRIILVCKAYHSRRALLTYQTCFPPDVQFLVSPVTDMRGITKTNWYQNPDHIAVVMGEVEKIGRYFASCILPLYQGRER